MRSPDASTAEASGGVVARGGGTAMEGRARGTPALITVIIPVRNGEEHLAEQLAALSEQTYGGRWELVIVDNGCTDGTLEIVERSRPQLPEILIVDASERRGLNFARNRGASAAHGELLAFCDADDVVEPGWLAALAVAASEADLVGGLTAGEQLNDSRTPAWRPRRRETSLPVKHGFLRHAPGGNCAVWRDVVERIAWDETFTFGSSDIEFSWRVQLAGYRLAFAPDAVLQKRFRQGLLATVRQEYAYGKSDALLYRRFRNEGMNRRTVEEAKRQWRELLSTVSDLGSAEKRARWLKVTARQFGRAVGSVRWWVRFL